MKMIHPSFRIAFMLVFLGFAVPSRASTGVEVSLTTSGYEFTPEIGVLLSPGGGTKPLPPQVIKASVVLKNNTSTGLKCTIDSGIHFEFTVFDATGKVVWNSLPLALPQFVALEYLPAGNEWLGTAAVPLFIKGKALPPGTYTLQAALFGTPEFSATTSFIVHNVIAIN